MSHTKKNTRTGLGSHPRGWATVLRHLTPVLMILGLAQSTAVWATSPTGNVDSIATGTNGVAGWAYDPDTKSTSINMQLKINGVLHVQGAANVYRSDVNSAFGITGNHGFLYTFPDISSWGSFKADVYAMDSSGVGSTLIGTRYSVKVKTGAASATVKVGSTNYTADSSGNYFFHNITGGSTFTITPSKSGVCFTPLSITRTVTAGVNPSDVVFSSGPCLSISGSVGAAGAGATVGTGVVSTTASSTGAYTISNLPAATYTITANKPACTFSPASQSVTLSSANATGTNFTTSCSYAIFGTAGVTGGGATVTAGGKSVVASSTGSFAITGLNTGTYTLTASKPGCTFNSLSVTLGPDATNKNLTATCGFSISGSVGGAAAGATVQAGGQVATASSTGAYTINGLGAGTYTLSALKPGCTFNSLSVTLGPSATGKNLTATCAFTASGSVGSAGAGAVLSAGGKTATASVTGAYTFTGLAPGATYTVTPSKPNCTFSPASITGTINSNQTGLNFTTTCAYSASGSVGSSGAGATLSAGGKTVTASSTGDYSFTGLSPGSYTLTPSKAGCTFSPASITGTINSNQTGLNFTTTCAYSVSGSVGAAGAGATLTTGGQTVTALSTGAYSFASLSAGTYTLTPSKSGCTFSPASFTGTISSNVTGLDFTATCGTVLPPMAETITEEPAELRWTDVVMNVLSVQTQTGEGLVIEIDFANLHRVKVYDSDPFWFKYYRGFFGNTPGSFKGVPLVTSESRPTSPTSGCWTGMKNSFPISGITGTIYTYQECYGIVDSFGGGSDWQAINHNLGSIGAYVPGTHSWVVGPTYLLPNSLWNDTGIQITASWRGMPSVTLDYGSFYNPRYYQMGWSVLGGEVTADGFGLVPEQGEMPTRFFWVKDVAKTWMGPIDLTNTPTLPSPTSWNLVTNYSGLSDKSTAFQKSGVSLGLGDDITGDDQAREGFYVIAKNPNGSWSRSERVNMTAALAYMKDSRSLVINGSGNNFQSAMGAMERIVQESGKPYSVAYYMPQSIGPASYLAATNQFMRNDLTEVFNRTAAEGWKLNVATHSWSGYVTTTTCANNCQNINHISFAPATMPSLWSGMGAAYKAWNGTATVVVGNKDLLSDYTAQGSRPADNSKITEMRVDTPHPVARILGWTDFKNLWKY